MDLSTSKIELAKMILDIDNQEVIDRIRDMLKSNSKDFWDELTEKEKKSIQIGIQQLDNDEGIPLEEFTK